MVLPVLRRTVADVRTARAMLLTLPPELLLRVPTLVRYLQDITEGDSASVRRASAEDGGAAGGGGAQDSYEVVGTTPAFGSTPVVGKSKRFGGRDVKRVRAAETVLVTVTSTPGTADLLR